MISIILSIMSLLISVLTLLFYLFQEYREVFTLYWFSEYEVILIPNSVYCGKSPSEFIRLFNSNECQYKGDLCLCEFSHIWVGDCSKIYYYMTLDKYGGTDLSEMRLREFLDLDNLCDYFSRIVITRKGYKARKNRMG